MPTINRRVTLSPLGDNCRKIRLSPYLSLAALAILIWAGWQRIKPRRGYIYWTMAADPWGKIKPQSKFVQRRLVERGDWDNSMERP